LIETSLFYTYNCKHKPEVTSLRLKIRLDESITEQKEYSWSSLNFLLCPVLVLVFAQWTRKGIAEGACASVKKDLVGWK
jgi:hypothetical protein